MPDSYQLIGTYGADADTPSQWLGVSPGYTTVDGVVVVNFGGLSEPSGSGVQQLNVGSDFGSDLTDVTTLFARGTASVTDAYEYDWNGQANNPGGGLSYSVYEPPAGGIAVYTVTQPMSEWGKVRNYVLNLTTADDNFAPLINITGFESTSIKIGDANPPPGSGLGTLGADIEVEQVSSGYFDMSQADGLRWSHFVGQFGGLVKLIPVSLTPPVSSSAAAGSAWPPAATLTRQQQTKPLRKSHPASGRPTPSAGAAHCKA